MCFEKHNFDKILKLLSAKFETLEKRSDLALTIGFCSKASRKILRLLHPQLVCHPTDLQLLS